MGMMGTMGDMFGGEHKKPEETPQTPELAGIDREANDLANKIAQEDRENMWTSINLVADTILGDVNRMFSESGADSNNITLKNFLDYLVEEKPLGYVDTSYKIKHFRKFFPDEVQDDNSMTTFLQKVEKKKLQALAILNSKS